jgi:hypothetical protein
MTRFWRPDDLQIQLVVFRSFGPTALLDQFVIFGITIMDYGFSDFFHEPYSSLSRLIPIPTHLWELEVGNVFVKKSSISL